MRGCRVIVVSILKFEDRTRRDLKGMIDYMCDSAKTDLNGIFGLGVNPENAFGEMKLVQNVYHRDCLLHEYVQVIFCFEQGITEDISFLREVCVKIGQVLITDVRQVLGAIHYLGTDKIHCHYLINYVGIDGTLYRQRYSVLYYKMLVNKILSDYGLQPIKYTAARSDTNFGV